MIRSNLNVYIFLSILLGARCQEIFSEFGLGKVSSKQQKAVLDFLSKYIT